ncbi:MAG TPA: serine/threonine-protein kinase [Candidatus Obscuribacterales bacterium]
MVYCLNPSCRNPINPDEHKFCQSCGSQLLLRNRYRVIKPIGGGGFGRTYQAEDTDCMNGACVIKQFLPSPNIQADPASLQKATELFNQEAVRLFQLGEHPQIPRLLAHFEQDKRLYLVQEFIDGQNLLTELQQQGAFSEEKIWQLLADLLPVLKLVHDSDVIHRDIKPENIMRRRKDGKLVLIDFGVSKQATGRVLGTAGTTVGTPGYAPIEQMRGQAYPASDLYSLGVTCVALLTECLPMESGSTNLYDVLEDRWIWRERLPDGTNISPTLGQVLDKLLQERVRDRYQSADEVLQAISDDLSSAVGINYSNLRNLLAAGNWKEADAETLNLILEAAGRKNFGWLTGEDGKKFPRKDLRTINELWAKYSNGRFSQVGDRLLQSLTDDLSSAVGVNYSNLRNLLAAGNWEEADAETVNVMLKAAGRENEGWIDLNSIKKFPCPDLLTINSLWLKYSNGHFGFSVQKSIWESVGGKPDADKTTYKKFCDRLGWHGKGDLLYYSNLTFDITAPKGHLPSGRTGDIALLARLVGKLGGFGVERISSLVSRLVSCGIQ